MKSKQLRQLRIIPYAFRDLKILKNLDSKWTRKSTSSGMEYLAFYEEIHVGCPMSANLSIYPFSVAPKFPRIYVNLHFFKITLFYSLKPLTLCQIWLKPAPVEHCYETHTSFLRLSFSLELD